MANVNDLTAVAAQIYARALLALREYCVMPKLVNNEYSEDAAKKGDVINIQTPASIAATDVTPSNIPDDTAGYDPTNVALTLNYWKKTEFFMNDKDIRDTVGSTTASALTSAVRGLANAVNLSIFNTYKGIYGAVGAAGTDPFQSDTGEAQDARRLLSQQVAPAEDRRLVLDPVAYANASGLPVFQNANQRGDTIGVTTGEIGQKLGFTWWEDQQVPTHTRNAIGAGALTVNGVNAAGATTLSIAKAAGANWEALEGDLFTIAGDTQQYVITADTTVVQGTNTSVPISPALQVTTAGGEAITTVDTHVVNLAFSKNAIGFASRPMADTEGLGNIIVQQPDPVSMLSMRLEISRQNKRILWALDMLWGVKLVRPELAVRLMG